MSSVWDDPTEEEEEVTPKPGEEVRPDPLSIPPERLEALAVQVIEKVVREVVPEIAETIIKERLDNLLKDSEN